MAIETGRVMRPRQVRGANSAVVLELLRHHEQMSRAEVARHSGLSEGTVSRIVVELMQRRLVMEDGVENSTGGRPSTRLRLQPNRFAVGVDIRNWETRFVAGTMPGGLSDIASLRTPVEPAATIDMIAEQYAGYCERLGPDRLVGICSMSD